MAHFWFSEKQLRVISRGFDSHDEFGWHHHPYRPNYARLLGGARVLFTMQHSTMDHGCQFDDMTYLGEGCEDYYADLALALGGGEWVRP